MRVLPLLCLLCPFGTVAHAQDVPAPEVATESHSDAPGGEVPDALAPARESARGRALIEQAASLGIGAFWYYLIDLDGNAADWDFPSIKQRVTLASLRYDNNSFAINNLGHTLSGMGYYAAGRTNGLSAAESLGWSFVTSLAWEYGLEFREKTSINDIIVTPLGGYPLGEMVSRISAYLGSAPPRGVGGHAARWVLGFPHALHDTLDGYTPTRPARVDHLGYDADLGHAFALAGQVMTGRAGDGGYPTAGGVWLDARMWTLPGAKRPGRRGGWLLDAPRARLQLELIGSEPGTAVDLRSDALLLAYYRHRASMGPAGPRAHTFTVGTGIGFEYRRAPRLPGMASQALSFTRFPGLTVEGDARWGALALGYRVSAQPDFASLDAPGYPAWQADNPGVDPKTVLRKQGYYYGYGLSSQAELRLRYRYLRLGVQGGYGGYASAEGYDRSQEAIDYDVPLSDLLFDYAARVGVGAPGVAGWFADLGVDGLWRRSRIDGTPSVRRQRRYLARVGAFF